MISIVSAGGVLAALGVATAVDMVKRPVRTWHWWVPVALSACWVLPTVTSSGRWGSRLAKIAYAAAATCTFLALTATAAMVLLGATRFLRPESEVRSEARPSQVAGWLGATVVSVLAGAMAVPEMWGLSFVTLALAAWNLLHQRDGGPRVQAGVRTGASLMGTALVAWVGALGWSTAARLLPRAVVMPDTRFWVVLGCLTLCGLVWSIRRRVRGAPAVAWGASLVCLHLVAPAYRGVETARAMLAVGLDTGDPHRVLHAVHPNVVETPHGAWRRQNGWTPMGGMPSLAATEDPCVLLRKRVFEVQKLSWTGKRYSERVPAGFAINRGLHRFRFLPAREPQVVLQRNADGWWIGDRGPYTVDEVPATLAKRPSGTLALRPTRFGNLQEVVEVCTAHPDHGCSLLESAPDCEP